MYPGGGNSQKLSAGAGRQIQKSELLWLPTRHQLGDGLTKAGLTGAVREILEKGKAVFHGKSAKELSNEKKTVTSVNCT